MNGLSRQNKKSKNFIIKLGLVYVLSYIILGLFILLYPKYSNMKLDNNIKEYKSTINKALANSVDLTSLKKLTNTYPSQLVVKSEDELIYTNMEISESYVLSKIVDDSVVSYQEQYQEQAYDIYYLLYKEDNKIILNNLTTIYIIFTGVSMLCVILIIKKSLSSIHYSLDNAFNNIQKIKKNKLINNGSFEERINLFSEELKEFVGDIDKKVTEYQIVYTKLEKELLLKNETSEEKKKMVSLLVHDLKTPISIINLSVLGLRNQLNQELKQLNHIEEGSDEILADVKSILKVVNENDLVSTKTKVDLVKEVKDLFKTYQKMFKAKKQIFSFELLEHAYIEAHLIEIKSILNNIFGNIYNYSSNDSTIYITIEKVSNEYHIIFKNQSDEKILNGTENNNNFFKASENKLSTGFGLYLVNHFTQNNEGTFKIYQEYNIVFNELRFLVNGESNE